MLGPLASAAAAAIGGHEYVLIDLYLWHGFTPMLLLSIVTVALGLLIFRFADRWRRAELPGSVSAEGVYATLLEGMQRLAVWQTRRLQTGSLRGYMRAVFAVIVVTIGSALLVFDGLAIPDDVLAPRLLDMIVIGLVLLGAVATALLSSLLAGIAAVGLVGFGVALIFLLFGAPDLAFTQFAVETLFLVILTVLLLHLPHREPEHRTRGQRLADGAVAIGVGTVACLLLLAVLSQPFDRSVTAFYETVSLPLAHGKNIVNVILVDFRALDTLGEIAVLGFAGLALAALLRVTRGDDEAERSADR
jgi:multicomponent Na+:H+ antiporter subunit A